MKCYVFNGVTLTEAELYSKIKSELQNNPNLKNLKYAIFNIQEDTEKLIDEAHKKYNQPNSVGVHSFINMEHNLRQEDGSIAPRYLSPSYNLENRIINSIKKVKEENPNITTDEEARQEVLRQIAEEEGISDVGTLMHELFSIAVKARIDHGGQGCSSVEFLDALKQTKDKILNSKEYTDASGKHHNSLKTIMESNTPGGIDIDTIMSIIKKTCEDVEAAIFNGRDPRTKYKSEYEVATDELIGDITDEQGNPIKNVRGIIDLLIINPDGSVEVVDFKIASRPYNDWYAAKQADADYQLATYRQILAAHGINGNKVTLEVFPVYFPLGKMNQMKAEPVQNRTGVNTGSFSKYLDWDSGIYTKKIKQLIATKIVPLAYDDIDLDSKVSENIKSILGEYDLSNGEIKKATREEIIKSIWTSKIKDKVYYNVIDRVTGKRIAHPDKNYIIEAIDKMLPKLNSLYGQQVSTLLKEIKQFQATNNEKKEFELLNSSKNANIDIFNVLNGAFGKYCNSNYQTIEIPELLDLGILVFQNKSTGLVSVVRVTDKNIRTEITVCGNSTVLGKFASNFETSKMKLIQPLSSSIGNIQMIETMSAINTVAPLLQQCKIDTIELVNPQIGQREIGDLNTLKDNFKFLTGRASIDYNFDSILYTADTWEVMQNTLSTIIGEEGIDNDLRQIVSKVDTDTYTIQQKVSLIERCMQALENRYSQLRYTNFKDKRTFNTPQEKVYLILSMALLYYKDTPVQYDGKLSQWSFHFEEIIRLLGCPFLSQYKGTLNNGFKAVGFLQGLDMSTPADMPSQNLSALYQYWLISFQHIRKACLDSATYVNKITVDYFNRHGVSKTQRAVLNTSNVWENFIEKDQDGKYTKELRIINPAKLENKEDSLFLNQMLWEIQKYILPSITEEQRKWHYEEHSKEIDHLAPVLEAKDSGKYYYLPLRRATTFDRMRHLRDSGGLVGGLKKVWDNLQDDYDPRQLHTSAQKVMNSEFGEVTEMFNQYKISERARNRILESENVYDFEVDLNLLAIDVAFQNCRKQYFDEVLTHASAMATVFHYLNETTDQNFDAQLENLDDESKVMLKNEVAFKPELHDAAKAIGVAKRLNSLIVLGMRPLQFVKEITFGQFTNYSRAWALKGSGQSVSAASVFKANMLVWGLQVAGWMKSSIGDADLASFTLTQMLNKTYGIANEDLNMISKNNSLSRTGLKHGFSKYMYIFNSAPDFFNRMSLFTAKMIEDGCFDAHSIDKEGNLVYDIKKDKRFDKLVKLGLNSDSTNSEYLKQKSLYRAMVNQFMKEGFTKEDGSALDPMSENLYLPRAYTGKETLALKEVSDMAYGFYDHEAKSLNDHKFFGLVFKQFMAFWTAKVKLWTQAPGSITTRGKFVQVYENGKPVFVKYSEDANGKIVTEYTTENPNGDLEPLTQWEGEYVEGLIYSLGYTLRDIFTLKWSNIVGNPQRIGNLKLALHDILVGLILYNILRLIFSGGTGKTKDMEPIERTLVRAMQDTGPQGMWGLSIVPSFVSTFENLKTDIPNLFTEDPDVAGFLSRRFGAVKDITWSAQ